MLRNIFGEPVQSREDIPCEECWGEMKYDPVNCLYKCPTCGNTMTEEFWDRAVWISKQ